MRVLVTGGAGYIGSVVAEQLVADGGDVVVFDNLSQGHRAAVPRGARLVVGDLLDRAAVNAVLDRHRPTAVMHFAARSIVSESMRRPFAYVGDNVRGGLNLLEAMVERGILRFVLSSTANLFGEEASMPIDERQPIVPQSPYGESKYVLERIVAWLDRIEGFRYAALRYFNAAGATDERGEHHDPETHLIPRILEIPLGRSERITVFGDDYPTRDGTCVRDYIHVADLARAHLLALRSLEGGSCIYNLGNGTGFSVMEVLEAARRVTGHPIPHEVGDRRPGDPAELRADPTKIRRELSWAPRHRDLDQIVQSAWDWHRAHPSGYPE